VTDNGTPPLSDSKSITITVHNVNRPPILNGIGPRRGWAGFPLTFTVTASDLDAGDHLTLSATNLPSSAHVASDTGVFMWTPGDSDVGVHGNVVFTVTDNGTPPLSDAETITITVYQSPVISGPSQSNGGAQVDLAFYADGINANWAYQWTKDGKTVSGATASILSIKAATVSDAGLYEATAWDPEAVPVQPISAQHHLDSFCCGKPKFGYPLYYAHT
jgi:hypothetical protein